MNLGFRKAGVLVAAVACLILGGVWSGVSDAGPQTDADGDTVLDFQDNCLGTSNSTQTDSAGDGYGNKCDFDYDNNGTVGATDFNTFKGQFGKTSGGGAGYNADVDSDDNGTIGATDFNGFKGAFGGGPGPSNCTPSGCV